MRFVRSESIEIIASRERVFALVVGLAEHKSRASINLVSSATPHRCVHECDDGHASYRWTFDLTMSPTGTTVHQTVERLGANGFSRVMQPFRWELSQCGQVRAVLEQLKRAAERPAIPEPRSESESESATPVAQSSDAYS
jgi:hypothetical protein